MSPMTASAGDPQDADEGADPDGVGESLTTKFNRALGVPDDLRAPAPQQAPPAPLDVPVIRPIEAPDVRPPRTGPPSPEPAQQEAQQQAQQAERPNSFAAMRERRQQRRARVRRTRRTIRHVDPWSVLKMSVLLYACIYFAVLIAGVLLWAAVRRSGVVDDLESFIAEVGSYEVWQIDAGVIYNRAWKLGLVAAAAGVALNVLMAVMFNLISDLVGGVRLTILEEDERPPTQ